MAGAAGPCVFALPVWCCAFLNTKEPSSYCIARRRSRCRRAQTRSSLIAVNSLTSHHIAFRFARRRLKFIPSHAPMPLYYTSYSRARDWPWPRPRPVRPLPSPTPRSPFMHAGNIVATSGPHPPTQSPLAGRLCSFSGFFSFSLLYSPFIS